MLIGIIVFVIIAFICGVIVYCFQIELVEEYEEKINE